MIYGDKNLGEPIRIRVIDIIVPLVVQLVPLSGLNEETSKPYTTDNQIVKKMVQVQVGPPTRPFFTEGFFF